MLIGLFYRPPNCDAQYDIGIENSLDLALNSGNQNVTIIGDFNLNPVNMASHRKLLYLCNHFGLTQ